MGKGNQYLDQLAYTALDTTTSTGSGGGNIGDTVTSGTTGSILFVKSGPVLGQDNSNFFWDVTNHRLGLGNAAPTKTLDITGTMLVSGAVTLSTLTATRIPFAGTAGLLSDASTLTFTSGSGTLSATALQATGLTSGRVPFAGASGLLGDASTLAFSAGTLTATNLTATTAVTAVSGTFSGLTSGRVALIGTAGLLQDSSAFTATAGAVSLTSLTASSLTSGRITVAGTSGLLGDFSGLTYSSAAPGLTSSVADSSAATQIEAHRIAHTTSTTATAGIGVYQSFHVPSGAGNDRSAFEIVGLLRTVTDTNESGVCLFRGINAGATVNFGHLSVNGLYTTSGLAIGTLSATGVATDTAMIQVSSSSLLFKTSLAASNCLAFTNVTSTSGRKSFFITQPIGVTGITTTTERIGHCFGSNASSGVPDLTSIVNVWANGTTALQRENVWVSPTYGATSGTSSVHTMAMHHDFGAAVSTSGTTLALTGLRVARMGGAATQGASAAASTYVGLELVPSTITFTGSTQITSTVGASNLRVDVVTLTNASAMTMDQAASVDIVGPPVAAGSVTLTTPISLLVRTGATKLGGAFGCNGATPQTSAAQGATLTNNITSGGSANTFANFTDLTTYSADAAAIRNNQYQLVVVVKTIVDALRANGILT